jgi:hypothetical protein
MTTDAVVRTTKVPRWAIDAIERGDFECLPPGIYRRGYVRAYARAVGLDPDTVVDGLSDALPLTRVSLCDLRPNRESPASTASRHRAAALTDALVVLAITALHLYGSAAAAGLDTWAVVRAAPLALPALVVSTVALYVGVLGATGVGTVGARLFGVEFVPRPRAPIRGDALVRRSLDYLLAEIRVLFVFAAAGDAVESDASHA